MTLQGLLIHIAADSTNLGISGPINPENGHYDYIPLGPESEESSERLTYNGLGLSLVIPAEFDGLTPHYDPNPKYFTYGEPLGSGRGKQLVKLKPHDYFFPAASLAPVRKETYAIRTKRAIQLNQKGRMAKYLIGWYEIAAMLIVDKTNDKSKITPINGSVYVSDTMKDQVCQNAHYKRTSDKFVCAVGVKDGRDTLLVNKPIQLTQPGWPFRPNDFGRILYGNVCFARGWKWLRSSDKVKLLLSEINNEA